MIQADERKSEDLQIQSWKKTYKAQVELGVINDRATTLPPLNLTAQEKSYLNNGQIRIILVFNEAGQVFFTDFVGGDLRLAGHALTARGVRIRPAMLNGVAVKSIGVVVYE